MDGLWVTINGERSHYPSVPHAMNKARELDNRVAMITRHELRAAYCNLGELLTDVRPHVPHGKWAATLAGYGVHAKRAERSMRLAAQVRGGVSVADARDRTPTERLATNGRVSGSVVGLGTESNPKDSRPLVANEEDDGGLPDTEFGPEGGESGDSGDEDDADGVGADEFVTGDGAGSPPVRPPAPAATFTVGAQATLEVVYAEVAAAKARAVAIAAKGAEIVMRRPELADRFRDLCNTFEGAVEALETEEHGRDARATNEEPGSESRATQEVGP